MLTGDKQEAIVQATTASLRGETARSEMVETSCDRNWIGGRLARVLRIEWLGQTVASICWIASVLAYGISSSGDWLQLCAASSWLLANVAAAATIRAN